MASSKPSVDKAVQFLTKSGFAKQLAAGTVTGWVSGLTAGLVGKTIAFGVGSGVILFEIAQHKNFIKSDWKSLKDYAAGQASKISTDRAGATVSKVRAFALKNKTFSAGFVGGFLIGMSH